MSWKIIGTIASANHEYIGHNMNAIVYWEKGNDTHVHVIEIGVNQPHFFVVADLALHRVWDTEWETLTAGVLLAGVFEEDIFPFVEEPYVFDTKKEADVRRAEFETILQADQAHEVQPSWSSVINYEAFEFIYQVGRQIIDDLVEEMTRRFNLTERKITNGEIERELDNAANMVQLFQGERMQDA